MTDKKSVVKIENRVALREARNDPIRRPARRHAVTFSAAGRGSCVTDPAARAPSVRD
jgi:hypothetical protein